MQRYEHLRKYSSYGGIKALWVCCGYSGVNVLTNLLKVRRYEEPHTVILLWC
jgi:hypothetical protein